MPLELVVCDDGSTDDTLKIISEFSVRVPFEIRVYKNEENLHFTGNFLKAASLCVGDAIAFCDQDDIWDSKKIETCSTELGLKNADLLIHEGGVVDKDGYATSTKIPDFSGGLEKINKPPFDRVSKGFAMVVKRQVIQEIMHQWDWDGYMQFKRAYGPPLGHDLLIYAWCFKRRNIAFLEQQLVRYRVHGSNVTASAAITEKPHSRFLAFFQGLAFDKLKYSSPAKKWAGEAKFIDAYLSRGEPVEFEGLEHLARYLECKSRLWSRRAHIYDKQERRLARLRSLLSILFDGGYGSSTNKPRLGFMAFWKDAIVATIY